MKTLALLLTAALLTGCATDTGDPAKDARARVTNQALLEAGKVLGKVAAASLMNAARQEIAGDNIDWGHAASAALWSNAGTIVDSNALYRIIDAGSAHHLQGTAFTAAMEFRHADPLTPAAKTAAVNAIAATISAAAMTAPARDPSKDLAP